MGLAKRGGALLEKMPTRLSELPIDADKDWNIKGITNLKELAPGMTKGDLFFQQGGVLVKLSPGPIGHELTTRGPGQPIAWEPPPRV